LIAAAHRIDDLIHHRRLALKAEASVTGRRENILFPAAMLGDGS